MAGASAIYLEQGFDQFFKPGPGEHPFQLNPVGRITDEFMRFAAKHTDRGTPYTPVAFLLDPAHGWDMTDWPHFPLGVAHLSRADRALRELFLAAYYPAAVNEGEPATADRQAFTSAAFGDIFDVLVASNNDSGTTADRNTASASAKKAGSPSNKNIATVSPSSDAIEAYRALVVGGHIEWTPAWAERLKNYVEKGGTLVLNAAQVRGLPAELLGVRLLGSTAEADDARCLARGEPPQDLAGQVYRYERVEPRGAEVLLKTPSGDAVVTVKRLGRGRVVFCAVPDLLGLDERLVPAAAHMLTHLLADAAPVAVRGDVEYLVNRNARGWVVTLINNRGVYKPQQGLAEVKRDEAARVTLELSNVARADEWTNDEELPVKHEAGRDFVMLSVPPGGVRVVELFTKP
jgi:hypothetical protein